MQCLVYCPKCQKFELVDEVTGYYTSGNYTCPTTNDYYYSSYVIRLDKLKEMDLKKDTRSCRHLLDFYKDTKSHIDKKKSYYNDFGDFCLARYEDARVLDVDLLIDIITKYKKRTNKYIEKKVNESITIERKITDYYALVVNIKEPLKKNRVVFYHNEVRQRGWKNNSNIHILGWSYWNEYKSFFKEIDKDKFNMYPFISDLGYFTDVIDILAKHPFYEILLKAGCIKSVNSSIAQNCNVNGTKPTEILKINKGQIKILKDFLNRKYRVINNNYYYTSDTHYILGHLQQSPKLSYEQFNKIYNAYAAFYDNYHSPSLDPGLLSLGEFFKLIKLIVDENYDVETLLKYLGEDCRELQGIIKTSDALMYLCDYISFCKDLELKYDKYPKSLRLEHDKLAYIKILKADEINNKKIKERSEILSEYKYTNEKMGYKIIVPEKAMDLKREGTALSHCVGTYVDRFARGDSNIFFMRNIDDPDKALVTIELDKGYVLVQSRGFCNRDLYAEEKKFLNEWLKFVDKVNTEKAEKQSA